MSLLSEFSVCVTLVLYGLLPLVTIGVVVCRISKAIRDTQSFM